MNDLKYIQMLLMMPFIFLAACQALDPAISTTENRVTATLASTATLQTAATATVAAPVSTPEPATHTPVIPPPTPTRPTATPALPTPMPTEAPALTSTCPIDSATISSDTKTPGASVRVAFIAENGIQLWDEASNTSDLLFEADDVTSLELSDDQQLIAFTRENEQYQTSLWIVDAAGQNARELLSAADLLALNLSETKDLAVDLHRLVWIPGTHRLAFSTLTLSAGDHPPDVFREMRVIDAGSGALVELLDHDQGGTFTFSPDGAYFALVSDTSVSLYRTNGELVDKDLVIYPALGLTDFYYHPPIYWDADSQFFTFAMINTTDGLEVAYNPDVTSTIYQVGVAGWASEQETITGMTLDHAFSPDLERLAFMRTSPRSPSLRELHITDIHNEWDVVYREGESLSFGEWNPAADSSQFVFYDGWGEPGIGRLCHVPAPLPSIVSPGSVRRVNWVDAARYLYAAHPGGEFYLGSVDGSQKLIGRMDPERVSGRTGPLKDYDFYWPTSAAADSGTEIFTGISPLPTLTPVDPLPGMIYEDEGGVWLVEGSDAHPDGVHLDGGHRKIADRWGLKISPDGTRGLEVVHGDVWIHTLGTDEKINVTEAGDRYHLSATWWPANPDILVLSSKGVEDEAPHSGGPNRGRLTLVNADGSGYRVVQANGSNATTSPAPSPDGRTIAYDMFLNGMLYDLESGAKYFDPGRYGLPEGVKVIHMGSPSWSPDGERLAWIMGVVGGGYGRGGSWDIVLGVFDLEAGTVELNHPYEPIGRGGWLPPATWSTDGEWLTFSVESWHENLRGLWVTAADGYSKSRLSPLSHSRVIWSPEGDEPWANGQTLLLLNYSTDGSSETLLVDRDTWQQTPLALPDATVIDWRALP